VGKYLLLGALLLAGGALGEFWYQPAAYILIGVALMVAMSRKPGPEDD
jgi:hypothetical protein